MQRTLRAILPVLVASLVLTALFPSAAGAGVRLERYRDRLLDLVNDARVHRGIPRLHERTRLDEDAQRHSARMARERRLFHTPDLYSKVRTFDPRIWGENVGVGSTIRQVFRAWMRSAPHRANVLDRRYDSAGLGIVRSGGRFWITMIYIG
jgi:uncharacterized protein YkwD